MYYAQSSSLYFRNWLWQRVIMRGVPKINLFIYLCILPFILFFLLLDFYCFFFFFTCKCFFFSSVLLVSWNSKLARIWVSLELETIYFNWIWLNWWKIWWTLTHVTLKHITMTWFELSWKWLGLTDLPINQNLKSLHSCRLLPSKPRKYLLMVCMVDVMQTENMTWQLMTVRWQLVITIYSSRENFSSLCHSYFLNGNLKEDIYDLATPHELPSHIFGLYNIRPTHHNTLPRMVMMADCQFGSWHKNMEFYVRISRRHMYCSKLSHFKQKPICHMLYFCHEWLTIPSSMPINSSHLNLFLPQRCIPEIPELEVFGTDILMHCNVHFFPEQFFSETKDYTGEGILFPFLGMLSLLRSVWKWQSNCYQ